MGLTLLKLYLALSLAAYFPISLSLYEYICTEKGLYTPYMNIYQGRSGAKIFQAGPGFYDMRDHYDIYICINGPAYLYYSQNTSYGEVFDTPHFEIFVHKCGVYNKGEHNHTHLPYENRTLLYGVLLMGEPIDYRLPSIQLFTAPVYNQANNSFENGTSIMTFGNEDCQIERDGQTITIKSPPVADQSKPVFQYCIRPFDPEGPNQAEEEALRATVPITAKSCNPRSFIPGKPSAGGGAGGNSTGGNSTDPNAAAGGNSTGGAPAAGGNSTAAGGNSTGGAAGRRKRQAPAPIPCVGGATDQPDCLCGTTNAPCPTGETCDAGTTCKPGAAGGGNSTGGAGAAGGGNSTGGAGAGAAGGGNSTGGPVIPATEITMDPTQCKPLPILEDECAKGKPDPAYACNLYDVMSGIKDPGWEAGNIWKKEQMELIGEVFLQAAPGVESRFVKLVTNLVGFYLIEGMKDTDASATSSGGASGNSTGGASGNSTGGNSTDPNAAAAAGGNSTAAGGNSTGGATGRRKRQAPAPIPCVGDGTDQADCLCGTTNAACPAGEICDAGTTCKPGAAGGANSTGGAGAAGGGNSTGGAGAAGGANSTGGASYPSAPIISVPVGRKDVWNFINEALEACKKRKIRLEFIESTDGQMEVRTYENQGNHPIHHLIEEADNDFSFNWVIETHWKMFATVLGVCSPTSRVKQSVITSKLYTAYTDDFLKHLSKEWIKFKDNLILQYILGDYYVTKTEMMLDDYVKAAFISSQSESYRPLRPLSVSNFSEDNFFRNKIDPPLPVDAYDSQSTSSEPPFDGSGVIEPRSEEQGNETPPSDGSGVIEPRAEEVWQGNETHPFDGAGVIEPRSEVVQGKPDYSQPQNGQEPETPYPNEHTFIHTAPGSKPDISEPQNGQEPSKPDISQPQNGQEPEHTFIHIAPGSKPDISETHPFDGSGVLESRSKDEGTPSEDRPIVIVDPYPRSENWILDKNDIPAEEAESESPDQLESRNKEQPKQPPRFNKTWHTLIHRFPSEAHEKPKDPSVSESELESRHKTPADSSKSNSYHSLIHLAKGQEPSEPATPPHVATKPQNLEEPEDRVNPNGHTYMYAKPGTYGKPTEPPSDGSGVIIPLKPEKPSNPDNGDEPEASNPKPHTYISNSMTGQKPSEPDQLEQRNKEKPLQSPRSNKNWHTLVHKFPRGPERPKNPSEAEPSEALESRHKPGSPGSSNSYHSLVHSLSGQRPSEPDVSRPENRRDEPLEPEGPLARANPNGHTNMNSKPGSSPPFEGSGVITPLRKALDEPLEPEGPPAKANSNPNVYTYVSGTPSEHSGAQQEQQRGQEPSEPDLPQPPNPHPQEPGTEPPFDGSGVIIPLSKPQNGGEPEYTNPNEHTYIHAAPGQAEPDNSNPTMENGQKPTNPDHLESRNGQKVQYPNPNEVMYIASASDSKPDISQLLDGQEPSNPDLAKPQEGQEPETPYPNEHTYIHTAPGSKPEISEPQNGQEPSKPDISEPQNGQEPSKPDDSQSQGQEPETPYPNGHSYIHIAPGSKPDISEPQNGQEPSNPDLNQPQNGQESEVPYPNGSEYVHTAPGSKPDDSQPQNGQEPETPYPNGHTFIHTASGSSQDHSQPPNGQEPSNANVDLSQTQNGQEPSNVDISQPQNGQEPETSNPSGHTYIHSFVPEPEVEPELEQRSKPTKPPMTEEANEPDSYSGHTFIHTLPGPEHLSGRFKPGSKPEIEPSSSSSDQSEVTQNQIDPQTVNPTNPKPKSPSLVSLDISKLGDAPGEDDPGSLDLD